MRRALGIAICASALAIGSGAFHPAHADPKIAEAELGTARALFQEGVAREDANDWQGALDRFKRVAEIKVTAQVLYNIALCYDRLGKTASADAAYAKVLEKGGTADLVKLATGRRAALKGNVPEVTLDGPSDVSVTLDGEPATIGVSRPIDPGRHDLVSKRGSDTAKKSFDVTTGKTTIAVPVPIAPPPPEPVKPEPPKPERHVPAVAFVTGGLAVVGLGVGIFAAVSRASTISDLDTQCGTARDHCPISAKSDVDKVGTMSTLVDVGFGVAIVGALATAAIVYFGYVRRKDAATAVLPGAGPGTGGFPPLSTSIRF